MVKKVGIISHSDYVKHQTSPGHPESPERLNAIVNRLKRRNDCLWMEPNQMDVLPWVAKVHSHEHIERVRTAFERGNRYLDLDTPISADSYRVAQLAVAGILTALDAVVYGQVPRVFCAVRPPGHHAEPDQAMGFCLFNNVAIGARYAQEKHGLERVLIIDWDVHHGNGTQAMFYDDPSVLYFSIHQMPLYPGTGYKTETGAGKGKGFNLNCPVNPADGDSVYLRAFRDELMPAADQFKPQMVFVSAGFDAHVDDPLSLTRVTEEGFRGMTECVCAIADKWAGGKLVSALEGGYNLDALADSVEAHVAAMTI